jgi:hypothetical protein
MVVVMPDSLETPDDLEAKLLECITPSNAELKELAKRYPPPQSWYEETENPCEPTVCSEPVGTTAQ